MGEMTTILPWTKEGSKCDSAGSESQPSSVGTKIPGYRRAAGGVGGGF